MVKDMTSGKPLRLLINFSIPLILGNVIQQMYSWADTIMVGKLISTDALAAVGATGAITFFIIGFLNGVTEGSCILIARYFGAGDRKHLRRCTANIIYVCSFVVLLLTVFSLIYNRQILEIMKTPDNIIDDAEAYLRIIYAGMFTTLIYNLCAGLLRALGDSRSPLYFLIISAVLNVILNYIFIVNLSMGVAGAAYGTVISQLISGLLSFVYILKKCEILRLSVSDFKPNLSLIIKVCFMGIPMAFQYSITAIGSILLQTSINNLGSDSVAAITVGEKILNFSWAIMNCMGVALANYCSQNIGAARLDRVKKGVRTGLKMVILVSCIFTVLLLFFGKYIAVIFLDNDNNSEIVMDMIHTYFMIQSPCLIALALIGVFRNVIQGMGYSFQAMLAGVFELVGRSVVALVFVNMFGFVAVCIASPIAWILADLLLIPMYLYIIRSIRKKHPDWIASPSENQYYSEVAEEL